MTTTDPTSVSKCDHCNGRLEGSGPRTPHWHDYGWFGHAHVDQWGAVSVSAEVYESLMLEISYLKS